MNFFQRPTSEFLDIVPHFHESRKFGAIEAIMSLQEKESTSVQEHYELGEPHGASAVKNVQNTSLADAVSKSKPSPWTRRMFMVS